MKKKVSRTAANLGSKREKGISREVRVVNLRRVINMDALATLMVIANPLKHATLFYKVCEALEVFDATIQRYMVEALLLYASGEAYTITGIEHVDLLLVNLYHVFDRELLNIKNK